MTVALQIRAVPEDVRDVIAARAKSRGLSMQASLLEMVQREAELVRKARMFDDLAPYRVRFPADFRSSFDPRRPRRRVRDRSRGVLLVVDASAWFVALTDPRSSGDQRRRLLDPAALDVFVIRVLSAPVNCVGPESRLAQCRTAGDHGRAVASRSPGICRWFGSSRSAADVV